MESNDITHLRSKSISPLQKIMYWRTINQARGYANYVQIASANQKQQETKIQSMKKYDLKIRKIKLCCKKLLLEHIFNQCFDG